MKFLLISISVMMSALCLSKSKLADIYLLQGQDSNKQCYLVFFDNGKYQIEIEEELSLDFTEVFVISYGTFSRSNDEIILTDQGLRYTMKFVISPTEIVAKHSYKFLSDRKFVFYRRDFSYEHHFDIKDLPNKLQKKQDKENIPKFLVGFGDFVSDGKYKLKIFEFNKYVLQSLLSDKTFRKEGSRPPFIFFSRFVSPKTFLLWTKLLIFSVNLFSDSSFL